MPALQALEPDHSGYPEGFNDLTDPPKKIYVQGEITGGPSVAIVGSRTADRQGIQFTRKLASELARVGVMVISGGARGIDQAAHFGALEGGGRTIMVLGCGLNVDYPRGSAQLRRKIAESGAVISELPLDAKPHPSNFPKRNRIVAALSQAVVVVQAGQRSGALVTARLAQKLRRPVLAVPGQPGAELTRGTHGLLRQGALLAECAEDVLRAIGVEVSDEEGLRVTPQAANLSGLQAAVVRWLKKGPASVDELARGLERPVSDVLTTLIELEVDGIVSGQRGCYGLN